MLHAALKAILGKNVNQAGSLVAPERLRFDFTHPSALTHKQLTAIESWVNNVIEKGISVTTQLLPKEEAFSQGAVHLFDENYPDIVRVVKVKHFAHLFKYPRLVMNQSNYVVVHTFQTFKNFSHFVYYPKAQYQEVFVELKQLQAKQL